MPPDATLTPPRWQIVFVAFLVGIVLVWVGHMLFGALAYRREIPQALSISLGTLLVAALIGGGAIKALSTKLTESGASQTVVFANGQLISHKSLLWQEITKIETTPEQIRLAGSEYIIEVYPQFFSKRSDVKGYLRKKLPAQVIGNAL